MKKTFFRSVYFFAAISVFAFTACDKDDDKQVIPEEPHNHEEELVTTVKFSFQDKNDSTAPAIVGQFKDLDGGGKNEPVYTGVTLAANKTYELTLSLLDESHDGHAHDLTHEIEEEADDHQFFYQSTPAGLIAVTPTDKDSKNMPIGLKADAVTQAAGSGKLKVVLKHQPGTKDGNITTGGTDIDIELPISVQ